MSEQIIILEVSNVGGIEGHRTFTFSRNTLNILEGANATGKSSVAKALMAVLGVDDRVLHESYGNIWRLEASNLGLLPEKGGHRAGIVHANATHAEVKLKEKNIERRVIIEKNGKIEQDKYANSNFLLIGVLTPNSWIYRAISSPNEMRNESIFKNYITKLSIKAEKYIKAGDLLQEYYSALFQKLNEIKKKKAMIPNLKREIKQLEKEIEELQEKKDELIKMIEADSEQKKQEISKLKKSLETLERRKRDLQKEIQTFEKNLSSLRNEIKNLENRVKELRKEEELLKNRKKNIEFELSKPSDFSEFDNKIKQLQDERFRLQALADLYYLALDNVKEGHSECPLCETGNITREKLEDKLRAIKEKISKIEDELRNLARSKEEMERYRENLKKELKDIEKKLSNIMSEISDIQEYKLKQKKYELNNIIQELETKKVELNEISREIYELSELLRKENPELIEEIDRVTKLLEEKQQLLTRKESEYITAGYVNMYGLSLELDSAIKLAELALDGINSAKKYALEMAEKIRREAVKQFNNMVQDVLRRIGFSEFKRIYLDKNYILNVQYVSPEGEVKVIQPHALSESERVSVALVLMLALNKVYREGINYIVIDNMYEYFDEYRTNEILKVLLEYAKQENVTILLTKTSYEEDDLKVKVIE
jgi:DNA repair exonuclease SbcCD ATPase subunit